MAGSYWPKPVAKISRKHYNHFGEFHHSAAWGLFHDKNKNCSDLDPICAGRFSGIAVCEFLHFFRPG
jgi:hypothetical protein